MALPARAPSSSSSATRRVRIRRRACEPGSSGPARAPCSRSWRASRRQCGASSRPRACLRDSAAGHARPCSAAGEPARTCASPNLFSGQMRGRCGAHHRRARARDARAWGPCAPHLQSRFHGAPWARRPPNLRGHKITPLCARRPRAAPALQKQAPRAACQDRHGARRAAGRARHLLARGHQRPSRPARAS